MIPPVIIDLIVKGTPQIHQSIRNVTTTLARAEQQATRDAERGARAREKTTQREHAQREREYAKLFDDIEKKERKATNIAEHSAAARARIQERSAIMAGRYAVQQAREEARTEAEKVRAAERSARAMDRIRERSATMAGRHAAQQASREASAAASAGRDRGAFANAMVGAGAQGVMAGGRRVASVAMGLAGTAAQLGGGFSVADSVMGEKNMRHQAAVLSASTILTGAGKTPNTGRAMGTDEILAKAKAIGIEQNIDPAEILKSFDTIKKLTGNLSGATEMAGGIAKLATATGGDVSQMSGLAANVLAFNPRLTNEELQQQMRVFTRQGAVGGVEVADFAKYGSRLTAGASLFGGEKSTNLATMGAIAQISRQYGGAASPAEAAMAAQRFATDVQKHAGSLEKKGIKVSDGKGGLRDAQSILLDMLEKSGGDVTKLTQFGLGERGVKALTGVSAIYKDAGGGQAGRDAVKREFSKYTEGVTEQEVDTANARVLGDPGQALDRVMLQLRTTVGEQLLPEFLKLAPVIRESTPAFVALLKDGVPVFIELIKSVSDFAAANKGLIADISAHPIGAIMAFEVTKSIGAAGLGEVVKRLIASAFMGGGGGGGLPGVAGAGAGMTGVAGGIVAGGMIAQGYGFYDLYSTTRNAQVAGQEGGTAAGKALLSGTPAEKAAAEAALADARGKSGGGEMVGAWSERLSKGLGMLTGVGAVAQYGTDFAMESMGVKSGRERSVDAIKASEFVNAAEISRVTTDAIANGVREGARQGSSGPNGSGRNVPISER